MKRISSLNIKYEGGAAGHMNHIYDYTDLTLRDLKGIIRRLFSGKIEDVTEKLDGMNVQCTLNNDGKLVFVRNKGDLNSKRGGMLPDDIAARWLGKESVQKVYLDAYNIIEKVFKKIGKKFFNPDKNTKILVNCECITAGKTNVLLYSSAQVDFHNLWIYTREDTDSNWEISDVTTAGIDVLEKACENIDGAQLTPKVLIRVTEQSNSLMINYIKSIDDLFKKEGCTEKNTIDDYKWMRFNNYCNDNCEWVLDDEQGAEILYARWFNGDKRVNLREIKKIYKNHLLEFNLINHKNIVYEVTKTLDAFFSKLGNSIISLCDRLVNAGSESVVIEQLSNDLEEIVSEIESNGTEELKEKLAMNLNRLAELGNQINSTEGIVFKYNDRLMKVTGSFAAVNQILGLRFSL
jgi:hypothetical protein